jgi:hypothetical protein
MVNFNGKQVEGEELEFKVRSGEDWTTYDLEDTTVLKARHIAMKIVRVIGQRTPEGEPVYVVMHHTMVSAQVQPHLMENN